MSSTKDMGNDFLIYFKRLTIFIYILMYLIFILIYLILFNAQYYS